MNNNKNENKLIDDYYKYGAIVNSSSSIQQQPCRKEKKRDKTKERNETSQQLLERCYAAWHSLAQSRADRIRNIEYKRGNQWSDIVDDPENKGRKVKEQDLLLRQGKSPLKHNFIQQFIRNLSGQMINNATQSVVYARAKDNQNLSEMLTNALQACHHLNQITRLDMSLLEELILSGVGCCKIRYDYWHSKKRGDGKIEIVSGNRLFHNAAMEDIHMSELSLIGELHDYSLDEVIRNFASSPDDEKRISYYYGNSSQLYSYNTNRENLTNDFALPSDPTKCRVIEVWHRRSRWVTTIHDYLNGTIVKNNDIEGKNINKINNERIKYAKESGYDISTAPLIHIDKQYEQYWSVTFLTPNGDILYESETPYIHGEHPYILISIPSVDGSPRGVVSDLIDIQRYINRLIVMIDFIMGASAKGVLMVPENAIPDGYSVDDFTNQYVKANGVIVYKPNNTKDIPFQISSNSTNIGAWEMLSMQMNLIQEISGISGAIQGYRPNSNTPSSLYAQQAQNSQLNYKVLFETIRTFQRCRDEKLLKVLMQYYRRERYISAGGSTFGKSEYIYQPEMVKEITDFNLIVSLSPSTPLYRQINDDMLKNMLDGGQIDLEMFLSNSSLPFADTLLAQIRAKKDSV